MVYAEFFIDFAQTARYYAVIHGLLLVTLVTYAVVHDYSTFGQSIQGKMSINFLQLPCACRGIYCFDHNSFPGHAFFLVSLPSVGSFCSNKSVTKTSVPAGPIFLHGISWGSLLEAVSMSDLTFPWDQTEGFPAQFQSWNSPFSSLLWRPH